MNIVPKAVLSLPVVGVRLQGATFGDQFIRPTTLLIFLRHFGCIFCKEMVGDLRHATETTENFPKSVFVFQGTPEEGATFFDKHWPDASAISDSQKTFYEAFNIQRATLGQVFAPVVWGCGLRAVRKGYMQNPVAKVIGDAWLMPGMFLIEPPVDSVSDARVIWSHVFKHAGDHPKLSDVPRNVGA